MKKNIKEEETEKEFVQKYDLGGLKCLTTNYGHAQLGIRSIDGEAWVAFSYDFVKELGVKMGEDEFRKRNPFECFGFAFNDSDKKRWFYIGSIFSICIGADELLKGNKVGDKLTKWYSTCIPQEYQYVPEQEEYDREKICTFFHEFANRVMDAELEC